MRRPELLQAFKARFLPDRWPGIIAFCMLIAAWRYLEGESFLDQSLGHYAYIGLGLAYAYGVSPIPWQWTNDRRPMAPFLRGLIQAVLWNGFLLALPVLVLLALGKVMALVDKDQLARLARPGHAASWEIALLTSLSHIFWIACAAGWSIAREEARRSAAREAEEIRRSLEAATRQAQIQALQAQLDPHVLYNALSGVTELIHEAPAKAESAIIHLSNLYRRLTDQGKRDRVPMSEERHILEDYLAVEQVRLGPRLSVTWDWPEEVDSHLVPPLLIQPLVENAIKHGLSSEDAGGTLLISARAKGSDLLDILVANSGHPLDAGWQEGTGLGNLRARLALLGGGSSFSLRSEGGLTLAEIRVKRTR